MTKSRKAILEGKLTVQQRNAAQMIVDNEFGLLSENGKRLPNHELMERIGIGNDTFYTWKRKPEFRAYMNELADDQLDENRSRVYSQLMRLIDGGNNGMPSVKAIDLWMRRFGLLTDRTIVEDQRLDDGVPRKTDAEIRREIAELDEMINGSKSVH